MSLIASLGKSTWTFAAVSLLALWLVLGFAPAGKRLPALRLFGLTALTVILMRLVFRVIFAGGMSQPTLLALPYLEFDSPLGRITMLGPVSTASLTSGLHDGLRLAAIVLSIGMAATLASPRALLARMPAPLYEFGTAAAVAINLAPQLLASLMRVRQAQALRGLPSGIQGFSRTVTPVLEDAFARSLDLAASMDARGFGRAGVMSKRNRLWTRSSVAFGLSLTTVSLLLLVSGLADFVTASITGLVGIALIAAGMHVAGLHQIRTRLTPSALSNSDLLVRWPAAAAVALAVLSSFINLGWSL